jgi:outer membrane protein TolC
MRWKSWYGALPLLLAMSALTGGCKQRCFVTDEELNTVQTSVFNHPELEKKFDLSCEPTVGITTSPPTLYDLDRKVRFISLAECIAIALEQGRVGSEGILGNVYFDVAGSFAGGRFNSGGQDTIRVLALDPAIAGAAIEQALSKFDAVFSGSMTWSETDQPIATPLQNFQAGQQQGVTAIQQQDAQLTTGLFKPLPTGGVAGITFTVPYTFTNLPARVNPSYRPMLQFQFEQPLLQGFGVEINQLRAAHPGSLLNPGLFGTAPTQEGIVVTRIRFDQARAEFERHVQFMLLNVELAYWNLYAAYGNLYSQEQGLRFAYEAYRLSRAGFEAGRVKAADFYQTRGQYEQFRANRLAAIAATGADNIGATISGAGVLERERELRALLNLPLDDGTRLVPSDAPTLAPFRPDWQTAAQEALANRPELYLARQEVKVAQMNIILAKNQLLPDLRFTATYDWNAVGSRLDGAGPENALRNLASGGFNNWALGLRANIPIGYRAQYALLRIRRLELARSMEVLKDQEDRVLRFLGQRYQALAGAYELIRANRAQREAFGEQLRARQQEFLAGRGTLDILLEAQRFWAQALALEYQSIAAYNSALAAWEFAKGTIPQHDNVLIAEGPLPPCARERAVEHLRERTKALILLEHPLPPPNACTNGGTCGAAPSLPALFKGTPPLREAKEAAPPGQEGPAGEMIPAPVEVKVEELFPPAPAAATAPPARPAGKKAPSTAGTFGTARPEAPLTPPAPPTAVDAPPGLGR